MFYTKAHVLALQDQIRDLQERLDKAAFRSDQLLDRLLARNNVEPVLGDIRSPQPTVEVLSPFGAIPLEAHDAIRQSWIEEEAEYIAGNEGLNAERATQEAERRYTRQHQKIQ